MTPRRYGPLPYVPITRRPKLTWPGGARVALWVNPNIEFFGLDDVMPSNLNERVPREHAKIPNVRNWAVRDYGNRVGIWRIMEVLTRYGIRASAALNSEVCDHHPEIIEEAGRLGWELIGHNQTNALRLTEMDEAQERDAVRATIDRIATASGKRPVGWLGAGLAETWSTSITSRRPASVMSATGSTTTSRTCSRSATRRWCRCPIRCRPTTCRPISR
jgi:allantoinase